MNLKLSELNIENEFVLNDTPLQNICEYNCLILDSNIALAPLFVKVKKIASNTINSLIKIRNNIDTKCALTICKQTIVPLIDYSGFMLISGNISDELQKLPNNALRVCFNVKLRDRMSIECMHNHANLLSLEQRRQKQLLCLMFIFKARHYNVRRIHLRSTRAANVYSFTID